MDRDTKFVSSPRNIFSCKPVTCEVIPITASILTLHYMGKKMKHIQSFTGGVFLAFTLITSTQAVLAQDDAVLEEIVVTGSRILRNPMDQPTAVMDISSESLDKTGATNLGDILQDLPITGSAPNSQFNVPGNSGFPQDGAGIGAGSVQLSLRNI